MLRVKHVDVAKKLVYQRASEVKTKRAKSMVTAWFPIDADLELDWIEDLKAMEPTMMIHSFQRARIDLLQGRIPHLKPGHLRTRYAK